MSETAHDLVRADDEPRRHRLLLLAYSCCPGWGSEPGVGWNRAVQAARHFDTWVLCESWSAPDIRRYLETHGDIPGLNFVFIPDNPWLHRMPKCIRGLYLWYNLWHRRAYRVARRLHDRLHFDLVHQTTLGSYREPGYGWKLGAPFIWGPVGGTQNYPWRFLAGAGLWPAVKEAVRSLCNRLQLRFDWRIGRAARKAAVVLVANSTVQRDFERFRGIPAQRMLETGIQRVSAAAHVDQEGGPLRILWSGGLAPHKALHLLIRALERLPHHVAYELRVLGSGPLAGRWQRLARRTGVDRHTTWLGRLPHDEALACYGWADVFVFTSLRDTSGNVVLESLAAGVPVVCLDHQGVADMVTPECGVKIPVTTPRRVITRLADVLCSFATHRETLTALGRGAIQRARHYLWSVQGQRMEAVYRQALASAVAPCEATAPPPPVEIQGENSGIYEPGVPRRRPPEIKQPVLQRLYLARNRLAAVVARGVGKCLGDRSRGGAGVLMYHRVAPTDGAAEFPSWTVSPQWFRSQIEGLLSAGYQIWPLRRILECHVQRLPLPPRVLAITFDDGCESIYRHAWPILRELHLPATVFVVTSFVENADRLDIVPTSMADGKAAPEVAGRSLTSSQCTEMLAEGRLEIGSHGHVHGDFRNRPGRFRDDLLRSLRWIRERFGLQRVGFSFPYGFYDTAMTAAAREAGVLYAMTTRSELVRPGSDWFALGRFGVEASDTPATLAGKLNGWYTLARDAWLWLRRYPRLDARSGKRDLPIRQVPADGLTRLENPAYGTDGSENASCSIEGADR